MLKFFALLLPLPLLFAAVPLAHAKQNPTPPSSGIVVHLFGPDSVMNNVLPTELGGGQPEHGGSSAAGTQAGQGSNYVEPSTSDILHQMFVTGDPNRPTTPSTGRAAERP